MEIRYNLAEIDQAAKQFLQTMPKEASVVAFHAQMGAGKTTLIKAICQQLGATDNVTSPTFAIVNEYTDEEGNPINHFDLYRLKNMAEAYDIGLPDYLASKHLCLIEWPEVADELLPDDTLHVKISVNPDETRTIST